jgi:transcriptional regulatory protein RtcR
MPAMAPTKPTVVLAMLGPTLDAGQGPKRWERWRPTVALCQHQDLLVSRLDLLHDPKLTALAELVARDVAQVSPETEVQRHEVAIQDPWDFEEVYGALHDFSRSYPFHPEREDYLVHITTGTHVAQICLFLLTESRHFPARLLQTGPPTRRDPEPPGTRAIIDLDLSRYDRIASRFRAEKKEGVSFLKQGIETRNAAYNRLIARIEQVAVSSRSPMLLMGPTGAGKSQLAKRIFELKKARLKLPGEMVEVNCATLRGDQSMAALFGHTKGAFTGATAARPGLLRKADGGVLFLDEIGELGADEQAMLLRAIEEKAFYPVGSDREVKSDFLLLAGTNRDLSDEVASGRFRGDLHARIDLWTFVLPGLAERTEDLLPNLEYETERAAAVVGTRVTWSREARERYLEFGTSPSATWKANFRDLNASVTRMATLATGGRITSELVEEEIGRLAASWRPRSAPSAGDPLPQVMGDRAAELDRFDRVQLAEVVRVCRSSRSLSDAGRKLFESSRAKRTSVNDADRLRKYLARFGLSFAELDVK